MEKSSATNLNSGSDQNSGSKLSGGSDRNSGPAKITREDVVVVPAGELGDLVRAVLQAAGADQRNASRVAEALVSSNLSGVETHGVWHLAGYVAAIKAGDIVPTAWPEILSQTPTTALVSGNWTFGHVVAKYAMELAIEKAKAQNVAVVGIVKSGHIGRLGEYVELAASAGMISQVWGGGQGVEVPAAVPYGGRQRALHTNPVAMAFPVGESAPMMFDIATTALSGVKIVDARDQNKPLPPDSIVDKDGNPTTDAADFFAGGAHVPFGKHKGYAFMMAAEFLGLVLTGADRHADPQRGGPIFRNSGTVFMVMKSDIFRPLEEYLAHGQELCARIRSVPPVPGFKEVLVPGDPEARTRALRLREGIPIPKGLWQKISELPRAQTFK
jgi:LDH2 family malate/lactate/ureidoglycolate dehydrogenase